MQRNFCQQIQNEPLFGILIVLQIINDLQASAKTVASDGGVTSMQSIEMNMLPSPFLYLCLSFSLCVLSEMHARLIGQATIKFQHQPNWFLRK